MSFEIDDKKDIPTRGKLVEMLNGGEKMRNSEIVKAFESTDPVVHALVLQVAEKFGIQVVDVNK